MAEPHPPLRRPLVAPMRPRDAAEGHRASTPLELLFDLTFVVAVAAAATALAHAVAGGHPETALVRYLSVFFAIWWAWMNFTWFASAYDVDDVPYRLLTLLQMAGALILAAGVPAAFERGDFGAVTAGYVVMRVAMLVQWQRAGAGDPQGRAATRVYIAGWAAVQVAWVLRLWLPPPLLLPSFLVLAGAELVVPWVAERRRVTPWHPHHIAERYGLFTLIVLGECVLAVARALAPAVETGITGDLALVAGGGLLVLFGAWWLYFLDPVDEGLARRPRLVFRWGYGHYGVFAALAAVGAGLEVAAEGLAHPVAAPPVVVALAIGVPLAAFVVLVSALYAALGTAPRWSVPAAAGTAAATVGIAAATGAGLPLPLAVPAMGVPLMALVAARLLAQHGR